MEALKYYAAKPYLYHHADFKKRIQLEGMVIGIPEGQSKDDAEQLLSHYLFINRDFERDYILTVGPLKETSKPKEPTNIRTKEGYIIWNS